MKKTNINYPYPVLSAANDDYINCSFNIGFLQEPFMQGSEAVIEMSYALNCDGLNKMIQGGNAKVVLYLESVETEYRKIFEFDNETQKCLVTENKSMLSKNLQARGYIVSKCNNKCFRMAEHNTDLFGDIPFSIRCGDILAISKDFYNIPIKDYDPLAERKSIFSIRRQTSQPTEEILINLRNPKITILLNDELYEQYNRLNEAPETRTILASLFAIPALVDVLSVVKNAGTDDLEEYANYKWYDVLNSRLKELKIELQNEESMIRVANLVIPHFFKQGVDKFEYLFNESISFAEGE